MAWFIVYNSNKDLSVFKCIIPISSLAQITNNRQYRWTTTTKEVVIVTIEQMLSTDVYCRRRLIPSTIFLNIYIFLMKIILETEVYLKHSRYFRFNPVMHPWLDKAGTMCSMKCHYLHFSVIQVKGVCALGLYQLTMYIKVQ